DFAPGERAVLLLEKRCDALLHLNAALRERTGFDGEQTKFEWGVLCDRWRGKPESGRGAASGAARQECAPIRFMRHNCPPRSLPPSCSSAFVFFVLPQRPPLASARRPETSNYTIETRPRQAQGQANGSKRGCLYFT